MDAVAGNSRDRLCPVSANGPGKAELAEVRIGVVQGDREGKAAVIVGNRILLDRQSAGVKAVDNGVVELTAHDMLRRGIGPSFIEVPVVFIHTVGIILNGADDVRLLDHMRQKLGIVIRRRCVERLRHGVHV